jgi:hypothetical protein
VKDCDAIGRESRHDVAGAYEGEPNMFVYSSWPSYESASIPPS